MFFKLKTLTSPLRSVTGPTLISIFFFYLDELGLCMDGDIDNDRILTPEI